MKKISVWIAYDRQGAKLPIAVANTAKELSMITGVSEITIRANVSKYHNEGHFKKIEIEDDD